MAFDDSLYRLLFDAVPDVIMQTDPYGTIQIANSRFAEIFGHAPDTDGRFQSLLPEQHQGSFEVMLSGAAEGTSMPEIEIEVIAAQGRRLPMMLDVHEISGEASSFLLRLRDLREIKGLEQEYRNLFESIADAVFIGDPDSGEIFQVNRRACDLTGYAHGDLVTGRYDFVHEVSWETVRLEIEEAGGQALSGREMTLLGRDGRRLSVETHIRILSRNEGSIFIESAIDISERKALENRMQDLRNEWDAFIRHELRSPLTPILAFSQLLMEDYSEVNENEKMMKYLDAIYQGGKRLERLLDLTREVSQYENGEIVLNRSDVDVIETIKGAIKDALQGVGEEDSEFRGRAKFDWAGHSGTEPLVMSHDPQKVRRVVSNLVKNALEHDSGEVLVRFEDLGETLQISVNNGGEPIPEDRLSTIFEKFNTTKRNTKGTGLGTTIARLFIESHNGQIWATSSASEGTTFTIVLPKTKSGEGSQ
jgi:PAS domain S-box-containing protein